MSDPVTISSLDGAPNLAVDVQPATGGRGDFVLDESMLDDPDLLGYPPGAEGGWLNVVCDVIRVGYRRGASRMLGVLTRAEAGSCTVVLRDVERRFDPTINADAVHRGTPVRLRAWQAVAGTWDAVLFTGVVDELLVDYDQTEPPTVTLIAVDVIGPLAGWKSAGRADPGIGAGDTLRGRIVRMLDEMGLDSTARISPDSDAAYAATLAASTLADGWQVIADAQDAELGQVWVDAADRLVVRSRGSELSGAVRGTLSDWHEETVDEDVDEVHCCYTAPRVAYGPDTMTNRAVAARRVTAGESAVVELIDEYSGARFGWRATERRDLDLQTDAQLDPWAASLILAASEPELRVDSVQPAPWGAGDEAWRAVCETDLGDRWPFRLHPAVGPTVARTLGVLGIEAELDPDVWVITWHTVEAPTPVSPAGWLLLDSSELDSTDLLAPFSGIPAWR